MCWALCLHYFFLIHMTQRETSDVPIVQVRKTRTKTFQVTEQALAERAFLLRFVYIQTILNLNIGELCKGYKADWGNPKRILSHPHPILLLQKLEGRQTSTDTLWGGRDMGGRGGHGKVPNQEAGSGRVLATKGSWDWQPFSCLFVLVIKGFCDKALFPLLGPHYI